MLAIQCIGKEASTQPVKTTEPLRPKRRRRAELSPQLITAEAVRIADAEGLEAVSIRRVAAALDARPMSLYDHIGSKEGLLDEMSNQIVGEALVDDLPSDWRSALTAIARHYYAMFVGHPWVVQLLSEKPRFNPNDTRHANQFVQAFREVNVETAEIWVLAGTMNDYVLGHSHRAVSLASHSDLEDVIPQRELSDYPELAALPDYLRTRSTVERFEAGLAMVLDGIERQLA